MTTQRLYLLEPLIDNPFFGGPFRFRENAVSSLGRGCIEEDLEPDFETQDCDNDWQVPSLREKWTPPRALGHVPFYEDFPCADLYPCFSERACAKLKDLLSGNGELLPVCAEESEKRTYFVFHITRISDAVDLENSVVRPSGAFERFAFQNRYFPMPAIFRLRQCPMSVVVTEQFVDRVVENALAGFEFTQIWPSSIVSDSRSDERQIRKVQIRCPDLPLDTLCQDHVFVRVGSIDSEESRRATEIEGQKSVETLSLRQPLIGALIGSEECDDDSTSFVFEFCGPDVNKLRGALQPWVQRFDGVFVTASKDGETTSEVKDDWPNLDRFLK